MKVKLRDAGTIFYDMDNDVSVSGNEQVEVPLTAKVQHALRHGVLEKVEGDDQPSEEQLAADKAAAEKALADQEADELAAAEAALKEEQETIAALKAEDIDKLNYQVANDYARKLHIELENKKHETVLAALKAYLVALPTE